MEIELEKMLDRILNEIELSDLEYETAERSYSAIGEYIGNHIQYNLRVFPQGSFRLGTVIKPLNEGDEYDVDLVAVVDNKFYNARELKNIIGDALKNSQRYSEKLEEGKRCWTIKYADSAKYHADILPAMESNSYDRTKELIMTHRESKNAEYEFKTTNPEAYSDWFFSKIAEERRCLKEEYSIKNKVEIENIPDYKIKTTLQSAIKILKRYRDVKFKDNLENKPISIILTTLMARIYTGAENVYSLIKKFATEYEQYLEKDEDGNYKIVNPVNEKENFADKWIVHPERQEAFFRFMEDLKKELVHNVILTEGDFLSQAKEYKRIFGEKIVQDVYQKMADETRSLREESKLYINERGNLTQEKTNNPIKNHNFYGQG